MLYIVYVIAVFIYLLEGIGFSRRLICFWDGTSFWFILIPCLLVLICTRSLKDLGSAFLLLFDKGEASLTQYQKSLGAIKTLLITAVISGGICFFISMINSFRSFDAMYTDSLYWLILDISVAMLSLLYPLVLLLLLLPLYLLLKKRITV